MSFSNKCLLAGFVVWCSLSHLETENIVMSNIVHINQTVSYFCESIYCDA